MTQKELDNKWNELNEEDGNIDVKWENWLSENNCVNAIWAECNWGSGGVLSLVDSLIEIINSGDKVIVLEDPTSEGSDGFGYLVFKKQD